MTVADRPPQRPTARTRPTPPPDEGYDPIVPSPPAGGSAATPPAPRRGAPEPTMQLNVRINLAAAARIDAAAAESGRTKRDLIEHAIFTTYGRASTS